MRRCVVKTCIERERDLDSRTSGMHSTGSDSKPYILVSHFLTLECFWLKKTTKKKRKKRKRPGCGSTISLSTGMKGRNHTNVGPSQRTIELDCFYSVVKFQ